jgi:hypothetical protein
MIDAGVIGDFQPTRALRGPAAGGMLSAGAATAPDVPTLGNAQIAPPNYRLAEPIGSGGMGTVYRAVHTWLGRPVAIKFISNRSLADPEAVARFAHEIRAIGQLDHPNIVRATDAGLCGGSHFLVTELVDGCDLASLVKSIAALRPADACEIIRQAAIGLGHAGGKQIVHRDIKPSNLLLNRDGVVKIVDFGLARLASNQTALTTTGQMLGTLDFLAPEQAGDARQVDIRSDIYSLGCTLYYLLAGHAPFSGPEYSTPASKIKAQLADQPKPPPSRRGAIPLGVLACVERMMAKSPADRFQTPAEVAVRLERHTRGANLRRLVAQSAGGAPEGRRSIGEPWWHRAVQFAGSIPLGIGRLFWRPFSRRDQFQSRARREPLVSISGLIGLVVVVLILTHFSCVRRGPLRRIDGPAGLPPGGEVHYFHFGPEPAGQP